MHYIWFIIVILPSKYQIPILDIADHYGMLQIGYSMPY